MILIVEIGATTIWLRREEEEIILILDLPKKM
jgi:hypothetical protein